MLSELYVTSRTIPTCECGSHSWLVEQDIHRDSNLIRVDGFSDLLVETPDPNTHRQELVMKCNHCGMRFVPQDSVEAWFEEGGADGFGFAGLTSMKEMAYED